MAVGLCFVAIVAEAQTVGERNQKRPSLAVGLQIRQRGAYLTLTPTSITHIRRSSIKEFLRQIMIESLENYIFCPRALLILLRNVDQSHIVMSGRIIAFESDGRAQRFDGSGQTSQLVIGKSQLAVRVVCFGLQLYGYSQVSRGFGITFLVVIRP